MNGLNRFLSRLGNGRDIALAIGVLAIIGTLVLPMPGWMLDLGLVLSITLSVAAVGISDDPADRDDAAAWPQHRLDPPDPGARP